MAEKPDTPRCPDLRLTTDARIPTNISPKLGDCVECGGPCHEYINLTGGDGGNELVCTPCYANYLNDDNIPFEMWGLVELPFTPESIKLYDIKSLGINQTLECGCILTDINGGKNYITLCSNHLIFLDAKILMSELADIGPNGDCNWCDRLGENCPSCDANMQSCTACDNMFPEYEMTLCPKLDNQTTCLCQQCFIDSPFYYSEWGG